MGGEVRNQMEDAQTPHAGQVRLSTTRPDNEEVPRPRSHLPERHAA